MQIEFDVKLTEKDMYRFSMYHNYTGFQGIFSILIAIAAFAAAVITRGRVEVLYTVLYVVFGVIFLVYVPLSLRLATKRQFKLSKQLQDTLHYTVNQEGVTVTQNGESATLPWKQVYKITATKSNVLIYSTRVNAYIIPREALGTKYADLKEIAKANLEQFRYCIRR